MRQIVSIVLLIVLAAACGRTNTALPETEQIDDRISAAPAIEPGTGTEIELELPDGAPSGADLIFALTVTVAGSDDGWTEAAIVVETDGELSAHTDIDLSGLRPGASRTGALVVDLGAARSSEDPEGGVVTLYLELRDGATVVNARAAKVAVLADGETTRSGFGSVNDLRRLRLDDLLASGDITQEEHDTAYDATTEVVTGSVEAKD